MLTPTPQPQPPRRLPASVAEAVAEIRAKAGMGADPTNPLTTPIVDLFAPTVAAAKAGTRGVDLTAFDVARAAEPTTLADDIARQYPTVESIVRSVPLKPEQAAMVRNILGSALTAPPGQMTGVQVMALKRAMLNAGFDHGIAGAIAMRAEALLRSKRGEGVLPQPRAATMRRVRGQEMRRSMRTDNDEGPMLDFDAAVDVLEKARKQIETGPRGGKIVGYRTSGGKRTPIYEKPGAGASPSKGDEGRDAPKDAGGGEEAAEALRDHADAMEEQGAIASEVRKVAKRVEAAAKRKAKAAAAKAAADKLSEQAAEAGAGDEAGDEGAGTEAEVEANQAQLAEMQRDDVEGAAGTGEAKPASQADKAPEKAPAAAAGGDAEADASNAPAGADEAPPPPPRKTPTVDRDPVSPLGPEPDWDKIGTASNLTPDEALNRKEIQEARKQYEAMFERLAAIEHQITSELVPMFNAIKNDIRRAVETNGRSIPRPKNAPKPMTPVEFLWEKVTAFIEFVGKMIESGVRYAANKIKSIGGPKPPKGGDTEKSLRPVSEYHAALRKGGDGVSYLPTRILDGLFDVLRDAMAQDRMGEVAAAFASAYPYGADDGDGDEDDLRADERPPLLPSERRRQQLAASVTEFLSGLDDDDLEIPEDLALLFGVDGMEKGAGHKYIRRVPKAGGGYRYYYTEAAAARTATKGELVRVGDKVVEIGEVTPDGVEVDGKVMSHADWLNALSSHYAKLEADTLRRSVLYDRAVSRALRPGGLAGASPEKVTAALSGAMTRTGMTAESAARAVEWVVKRNGWEDSAKGALLGEMTVGDRAKWVQANYEKVGKQAEEMSGRGGMLKPEYVSKAVQKLAPPAAKVERPHAEMLAEALASAFPGKSFDDVVGMIRKAQAAEAAAKAPPKVDGDETSVYLPGKDGRPEKMPARYKLVEAGDLIASHDPESFSPRSDYPKGLQERAYHRDKAEQAKVRRNAASLIPEYVANTNPDAVNGAPLIDDDGVVLGGNSRTMSMQLAYKDGNGAGLKSFLEKNAQQFGLDAKDVAAMKSPVLVRVVDTKGRDPKLLVRQMNEGMTQDMDPRVMQVAMGRKLDEDAIGKLASDMDSDQTLSDFLDSPKAEPFIQDLRRVGIIDARNHSRYMRNGKLNADGKQLVERVLVGKVVGDPDLLSDTNPSVVTALAQAVPYMVQAEAHGEGYNLRNDLREALTAHNDMQRRNQAPKSAKDASRAVDDYIRNADMFGGDESTLAQGESPLVGNARARALAKVLFEKTGPRQLASVFRAYSEQANQNPEGQFSLFGAPKTPTEVFSDALAMAKSARTIEDIVQYAAEVAGDGDGAELAKSEGFTPPERVAAAAARGLRMREKVKGGTAVGVARARDLSNRKAVSLDTIGRMVSYFARHGAQTPDDKGTDANPSPWLVAWNLWGGDAGRAWANSIWERERGDTEKSARTLAESIGDFLADVGLSAGGVEAPADPPASRIAKSIGEFLGPLAGDSGVLIPPGEYTVGTTAYGRRALPGGLLVDVEVPAGGVRRGVGADGREWAVTMPADYGEFVGTMGTDGDPIDVFVGPSLGAPYAYIIGIQDPATGLHDEDKVMFGFASRDDAMACYRAAYDRRDLLMSVQRMSVPELQMWVERHGQSARRIAEGRPMRKGVSSAEVAAALASFGAVERVSTPLDTVLTSVQWRRAPDRLRGREGGEPVALGAIRRPAFRSAPSAKPHVEPVLVIKSATPPAAKLAPAGARLAGLLAKGRR